jgi:phosphoribosylamine--glycine ligase
LRDLPRRHRLNGEKLSPGGRVLCVVGLGDSVKLAQKHAYDAADLIHFDGSQCAATSAGAP